MSVWLDKQIFDLAVAKKFKSQIPSHDFTFILYPQIYY